MNMCCIHLGPSCVDPGTPGGMIQVEASFEVGGDVVYSCSRQGFSPNPTFRRCVYNNSSGQAEWNGTMPVCEGEFCLNGTG